MSFRIIASAGRIAGAEGINDFVNKNRRWVLNDRMENGMDEKIFLVDEKDELADRN
jgi:hypothetical protein